MSEEEIAAVLAGGITYPQHIPCHHELETVCGTCRTFPKHWPAHDWNCRTRGRAVSKHTHACAKYREDKAFVTELLPGVGGAAPGEPPRPSREQIEAMELPNSPHWHYRRVAHMEARRLEEKTQTPPPTVLRLFGGGVVYFIDCDRYTKIGYTSGPIEERIKGIEGSNPLPVTLWGLVKGRVALERRFHARFYKMRFRNEWFDLTLRARRDAKRLIQLLGGEVYDMNDGRQLDALTKRRRA